jgi:hypothetical protein
MALSSADQAIDVWWLQGDYLLAREFLYDLL